MVDWAKALSENFAAIIGVLGTIAGVGIGFLGTFFLQWVQRRWAREDERRSRKKVQLENFAEQLRQQIASMVKMQTKRFDLRVISKAELSPDDYQKEMEAWQEAWREVLRRENETYAQLYAQLGAIDDPELSRLYYEEWTEAVGNLIGLPPDEVPERMGEVNLRAVRLQRRIEELINDL